MSSPISEPAPASGAPGGKTSFMNLDSNLGAMLCYILDFLCCLGLVLAIVFLITEKENRFVKFHAVQSLFLVVLAIAASIILEILQVILAIVLNLANMGWIAGLLTWLFGCLVLLIFAILTLIGGLKAYGGQWYKLPIIGEFAWKIVNK
ncbi:MAG TPA: DUF4870 domain-containing protein [Pyrinomonadaceae bacterium]|jgi:uncharacterized membrane protein|nr:DUF4870 domain-containing protein [Pyrinomonadaceae bacterium]